MIISSTLIDKHISIVDYAECQQLDLADALRRKPVLIIKGFCQRAQILAERAKLEAYFDAQRDIYYAGALKVGRDNFQRFDMGNFPSKNPKCMRVFSLFDWLPRPFLGAQIDQLIAFRNAHFSAPSALHEGFTSTQGQETVFKEYSRVLQYPRGAGFLNTHTDRDELYPDAVPNMLLTLSERGETGAAASFSKGGLYYIFDGESVDVESVLHAGDLILHSQDVPHGVTTVDHGAKAELFSPGGRLSLIHSVYKFLR